MDISNLSKKELEELIAKASKRIGEVSQEQARAMREKLIQIAKSEGYDLYDLFGFKKAPAAKPATRSVKPKYRHPTDPNITWTGRGVKPRWVREALDAGKTLDDLLIK